jgi:HAD superfamily hydrolase (TIGR01484 family)
MYPIFDLDGTILENDNFTNYKRINNLLKISRIKNFKLIFITSRYPSEFNKIQKYFLKLNSYIVGFGDGSLIKIINNKKIILFKPYIDDDALFKKIHKSHFLFLQDEFRQNNFRASFFIRKEMLNNVFNMNNLLKYDVYISQDHDSRYFVDFFKPRYGKGMQICMLKKRRILPRRAIIIFFGDSGYDLSTLNEIKYLFLKNSKKIISYNDPKFTNSMKIRNFRNLFTVLNQL